jgi:DivIVA domain-containing protein
VARRVSKAVPVTGDEVRDMWFLDGGGFWRGGNIACYLAPDVDDLLRRVAAELDANRPAGALIENATFRSVMGKKGYHIDAVDWFLDRFLRQDQVGPIGTSADPWCDVGDVTQLVRGGISALARCYPGHKPTREEAWSWFAGQCQEAWRDFGQHPGRHLRWGLQRGRFELRTADQQTLASPDPALRTVSMGGRNFIFQKPGPPESLPPVIGEIAARSTRDSSGHFAKPEHRQNKPSVREVRKLVDEAGIPILYTSDENYDWRASFGISFPDGRWLRFPVRGTRRANAIMTAVDQAGNKIARYRIIDRGFNLLWKTSLRQHSVEISVNPDRELTDELVLAIVISAEELSRYFVVPAV